MSNNSKVYKQYAYIAGIRVPIVSTSIKTGFGSLASLQLEVNYSPFITRLQKFTKLQIFEQKINNGVFSKPTLEFDGVLIGLTRSKNLLGNVNVTITALTDGFIWNMRKQYDFYLTDMTNVETRGTDTVRNVRSDGAIGNFLGNIFAENRMDVGCAVCSLLTSFFYSDRSKKQVSKSDDATKIVSNPAYYRYSYNGRIYDKKIDDKGTEASDRHLDPPYYLRFLDDWKLANKVYGIATSNHIKDFFQQDRFIQLLTNDTQDLQGENTFWAIAQHIMSYGFYDVFDIPNPCYIPATKESKEYIPTKDLSTDTKVVGSIKPLTANVENISVVSKKDRIYNGLAEYVMKPRSVIGIPLKCNVIWPDEILSENIFYNYGEQPTRVLYQQQAIPGVYDNVVLTTTRVAGPHFLSKNGEFFKSLNTPQEKIIADVRPDGVLSDYEKEYGLVAHNLQLSYAFDEALLKDNESAKALEKSDIKATGKRLTNFLNYEFAQKFLGARQYNIQVDPTVDVVPGVPIVVLNGYGEHVIAFLTGVTKTWTAAGQKTVNLETAYPRYYYENIGDIDNAVDPCSTSKDSLKELCYLLGTEPIDGVKAGSQSGVLSEAIVGIYREYNNAGKNKDLLKQKYKRKRICTFEQFLNIHKLKLSNVDYNNFNISEYPKKHKFDNTNEAAQLSCNYFEVYNIITNTITTYTGQNNSDIVKLHLNWISQAQRV